MREYNMTIERRTIMRVIVSSYGETEEEAKSNALDGDISYEEEVERIEQQNVTVLSVDSYDEIT